MNPAACHPTKVRFGGSFFGLRALLLAKVGATFYFPGIAGK
jgi:hypothetical protein